MSSRADSFTRVQFDEITLISYYLTSNDEVETFEEKLTRIEDAVTQIGGNIIEACDFNSRAVEWEKRNINTRYRRIMEMVARTGLIFANKGSVATFRRPGGRDTISDITIVSEDTYHRVKDWRV